MSGSDHYRDVQKGPNAGSSASARGGSNEIITGVKRRGRKPKAAVSLTADEDWLCEGSPKDGIRGCGFPLNESNRRLFSSGEKRIKICSSCETKAKLKYPYQLERILKAMYKKAYTYKKEKQKPQEDCGVE